MIMRTSFLVLVLVCVVMAVHALSVSHVRKGEKTEGILSDELDSEARSRVVHPDMLADGCFKRNEECLETTGLSLPGCDTSEANCCSLVRSYIDCMQEFTDDCQAQFEQLVSQYESGCNNGNGRCFSGRSVVKLQDGSTKTMEELQVGDRVQTGRDSFSDVFSWGHRDPNAVASFLRIHAGGQQIEVTSGHYLVVKGKLVAADSVVVGDVLEMGEGGVGKVSFIETVKGTGLYNPHTLDGQIVVNGVTASIYTQAVPPALARVLLAVPKMLYHLGIGDVIGSYLHGTSPFIARFIPHGSAVVNT